MRKYKITLDTYKKQAFYIEFSSLDTDNFLSVVIAEKGVEKDISNCVLTLELDGQVITGEILDNVAMFDLTPALTQEEGVKPVQIGLYENGALTSMYSFQINISEGAGNIDYELNGFENPNLATEILCKISKNQETTNTALQEIYVILSQKLNKTTGKTSEIINDGNGSSPFATTEEVAQAIANLVDSSPDALNTLNELAIALGNDPNFSATVLNLIATKADKVFLENKLSEVPTNEELNQKFVTNETELKGYISEVLQKKVDNLVYEEKIKELKNADSTMQESINSKVSIIRIPFDDDDDVYEYRNIMQEEKLNELQTEGIYYIYYQQPDIVLQSWEVYKLIVQTSDVIYHFLYYPEGTVYMRNIYAGYDNEWSKWEAYRFPISSSLWEKLVDLPNNAQLSATLSNKADKTYVNEQIANAVTTALNTEV